MMTEIEASPRPSSTSLPSDLSKLTPLMKQYWDIKSAHLDKILLFRMGDFFEIFHEDALIAAPILGITLTQRNKKSEDQTPMCGVPHHSVAGPINRLLQAGYKVAICDQIEEASQAKGIVRRAVTRILTPGMVFDSGTLPETQPHLLASFDECTVSFLDSTTGDAFFFELETQAPETHSLAADIIGRYRPVELVLSEKLKIWWLDQKSSVGGPFVSTFDSCNIILGDDRKETHENASPDHLNLNDVSLPESAKRLLNYAVSMQGPTLLSTLRPFEKRALKTSMSICESVIRSLELFETYTGSKKGSFIDAIDRTRTSSGARLLRHWVMFPLLDPNAIEARQERIKNWCAQPHHLKKIRQELSLIGDIERRIGRISTPNCSPKDLSALTDSLEQGLRVESILNSNSAEIEQATNYVREMRRALIDDPPPHFRGGPFVRSGYRADLDELIDLTTNSQQRLLELEAAEREKTQIPSLKIKFNQVFGYYIEVTHTHKNKIPDRYRRKQTLSNAERFVTDELAQIEEKLGASQSLRERIELQVFEKLREITLGLSRNLLRLAGRWAEEDVITSLAWTAIENRYVCPKWSQDGLFKIKSSRHPVIEQLTLKTFVPNDIELKPGGCLLLTGPNMAGKSTFMRQLALTSLMAQMGSFVPASQASLPILDGVFTRIGASDSLSQGLSTFMVEMKETSEILKSATSKSLIIFDEVGRGTSTFDGMSLAQAILEHLLEKTKCFSLFATHYHELTSLEDFYPNLKNAHMSVVQKSGRIDFLYTLISGPARRSYGIEVANLAGLPQSLLTRASELLKDYEKRSQKSTHRQMDLFS